MQTKADEGVFGVCRRLQWSIKCRL